MDIQKRNDLVTLISKLVETLPEKEIKEVFNKILEKKGLPISVFKANISGLEIIVKYLKEIENKSFKDISKILNRKLSTIYNTYSNSNKKFKDPLDTSDSSILIPIDIFSNRSYSVLESIVSYLLDKKELSVNTISKLLNKNSSTVRTVYRRYKSKLNEKTK